MRIVELASGVSRRAVAIDVKGTAAGVVRLLIRGIACRTALCEKTS